MMHGKKVGYSFGGVGQTVSRVKMAVVVCGCGISLVNVFFYSWIDWIHAEVRDLVLLSKAFEFCFGTVNECCPFCRRLYRIERVWAEQVQQLIVVSRGLFPSSDFSISSKVYARKVDFWRGFLIATLPTESLANLGLGRQPSQCIHQVSNGGEDD